MDRKRLRQKFKRCLFNLGESRLPGYVEKLPTTTMKKEYDDGGGPAFPRSSFENDHVMSESQVGMTLRDYFAAAALTGVLAYSPAGCGDNSDYDPAAKAAYEYADAMLEARK